MKPNAMKRGKDNFSRKILCLAIASALLPAAALAQQSAEVELGLGNVSRDSNKFGEYSGLNKDGVYLIGNLDFRKRDADGAAYWGVTGTGLGLSSRNLSAEYGVPGNYKLWFEYDQRPKFGPDSAKTIYNGAGTNNLTLPANWSAINGTTDTAGTAAGLALREAKINPFLQSVNLDKERKNYKLGFSKDLGAGWDAKVKFRHEAKEGAKLIGAVFGNSGGNPRSTLIPEPIDYQTNEIEASVGYASAKLQLQVGYYLSVFNNQNAALRFQDAFTNTAWSAGAGYPTGFGQMALPPDNQAHQINAALGYNLTDTTRLAGTVALGRMTQNEAFLPYSATFVAPLALPRASLDGKIDTTLVNLNLTARPLPKLNLRASYRYDDRSNKTPSAQYSYIGGDSEVQGGATGNKIRTNEPSSYTQNLFKLDGDYAIVARTKLSAGYDYDEIKRTHSEIERSREHTYRVGLRRSITDGIDGSIGYARSDRKNLGYGGNATFEGSYTAAVVAANIYDNHPLLRKFNYADRQRDKIKFALNASPHQAVALQFRADYSNDDYDNSRLGITGSRSQSYTVDASFAPRQGMTLYAYYTYDNIRSEQSGRTFTSTTAAVPPPACSKSNTANVGTAGVSTCDWFTTNDDRIDTLGLGIKTKEIVSRLDLGADYTYSHGIGAINTVTPIVGAATGIPTAAVPMTDLVSRLHSFKLYANYKLEKNTALRFSVLHQRLRTADWSYDNVTPATLANVITNGQLSPNYSVNVIGVSVSHKYW